MATPAKPRRGRPPNPLDPTASHAARLGAKLRTLREARGLTLQALGDLISYTPQYVSEVERAKTPPTRTFIAACDAALDAHGALLDLLPAALHERDRDRQKRAAARGAASDLAALRCEAHSDAGEDVQPTNRRGLIGAGAGASAALGAPLLGAAPIRAGEVDPELPAHWERLLDVLSRYDAAFGPHDVLAVVRRELRIIAEHREVARGELRTELLRVESRWSALAAWLCEDTGDLRSRDAWTDRSLWLAQEAEDPDMQAFAWMRQSRWAARERDARRAVAHAEAGLCIPGAGAQVRVRCARQAAIGHALAGDSDPCGRRLAKAYELLDAESSWAGGAVERRYVRATEARCWLLLRPARAIPLYEAALHDWPRDRIRDGGLHQARLALACALTGERDRAEAEGRKAFAIFKTTQSATAERELKRLVAVLRAA
jgi:transcriptional regulator with XRE-family HTH domain